MPVRRRIATTLLFTIVFSSGLAGAAELERWRLTEPPAEAAEYLVYRLSYRGIFTAFAWKDLADIAFISPYGRTAFGQRPSCDLKMRLSTENYSLAEILRPTRYEWHSTVDPKLRQAYLVEEVDNSTEDEQNITWVDWRNERIELFRLRKQISEETSFYDDFPAAEKHWEKDGKKGVPAFLRSGPLIEGKYTPLVFDKAVRLPRVEALLDPLSLIYASRWHDYTNRGDLVYPITYEDEIRYYRAHDLGEEDVEISGTRLPARKIELKRTRLKDAEDEGFVVMWLSTDARRIPLQFKIKAKVGMMKVHIEPESLQQNHNPQHCIATSPQQVAAKETLLSSP